MASDHRGRDVHAGKRTRDQYPRLTSAIARMNRRDGWTDSHNTSWIPSTEHAMGMGERLIGKYNDTREFTGSHVGASIHKAVGEEIGRAFKERGLPDRKISDSSFY